MAERALAKIASQLQLAERLQHLIYLRSSLIVVSGKKGAGKSIAVENISNLLPVNTIENIVTLNSTLNESQVREKILSLLFDKPLFNPEEHLLTSVLQLQKDAIVVASRVLIIDNAQLLPDKMIVEFAEIIKNKDVIIEGEFNILFFCEQAYADKLFALLSAQFDALKNFYQEFKVPPLSNEEVEQLFRHESQQVKQLKKIVLSKEYVACLVACNGNPLEIITLVHKLHNLKKSDESATENKKAKKIINTCEVKKNKNLPKIILFVTILLIICGSVVFYFYPQFNMIDNPKGEIKAKKVENTVKKSHTSNTSNISKLRQVRQHQQDELKNELNIDMDKLVLNWSDIIDKNLIKDASHQTKMTKPDIIVSFIAQGNRLSEDTKVPMDVKKKQPIENKVNVALPPYVFKKGYIEK